MTSGPHINFWLLAQLPEWPKSYEMMLPPHTKLGIKTGLVYKPSNWITLFFRPLNTASSSAKREVRVEMDSLHREPAGRPVKLTLSHGDPPKPFNKFTRTTHRSNINTPIRIPSGQ